MIVALLREVALGERRVALAPTGVAALKKAKVEVLVQSGAGLESGFSDDAYREVGATVGSAAEISGKANVIVGVRPPELKLKPDQTAIALFDPLTAPKDVPIDSGATFCFRSI